jgi:hypothetical protein
MNFTLLFALVAFSQVAFVFGAIPITPEGMDRQELHKNKIEAIKAQRWGHGPNNRGTPGPSAAPVRATRAPSAARATTTATPTVKATTVPTSVLATATAKPSNRATVVPSARVTTKPTTATAATATIKPTAKPTAATAATTSTKPPTATTGTPLVSGTASLTNYESYPMCCPTSPNYSPSAPTSECGDYSGCQYIGEMAALGSVSFNYVKTTNLVAFYDNSDPTGRNYNSKYAGKTIQLTKVINGKTYSFSAIIGDTCGNNDCNNCCAQNSQPTGYLVDMEYYTALNNFGSVNAADGTISFAIY